MKLFNIDKKLEVLGFKKTYEAPSIVQYERWDEDFNFMHCLDFCHKANGNHIIASYQKDVNKYEFNNAVGLTKEETRLAYKKMKQLGWK